MKMNSKSSWVRVCWKKTTPTTEPDATLSRLRARNRSVGVGRSMGYDAKNLSVSKEREVCVLWLALGIFVFLTSSWDTDFGDNNDSDKLYLAISKTVFGSSVVGAGVICVSAIQKDFVNRLKKVFFFVPVV